MPDFNGVRKLSNLLFIVAVILVIIIISRLFNGEFSAMLFTILSFSVLNAIALRLVVKETKEVVQYQIRTMMDIKDQE
ncbi:hypothetical protein [Evansella tamaricis]|uniref:NADH dehydrogenase subunit 4L n=1 Tax=Evansella tamaricis TaxID=2069301 RepID=A0ABS6JJJ8_9BACI|nr:hypothetical protein [Evansella tamaricis]MBU9712493.1 hypothetical protein [Evansella tamaricis]